MASGISRVLGLGFLFGAKDDGAIRMTEDIGEGMENMTRAVREVGQESAGIQRMGNFINALNLSQLTRVGSALEGLADRAGALQGEISSTSLESHGAQFAQEYRAATAGLGEYRAEVDAVRGEISGLSHSLGVGSEGMLNYATTIARTGRSLEDYGLTMRDIAGLEQAGISNGQELAQTLTELDIGFNMGADGARRLADEVVAIGTRVGSGRQALEGMRGAVEAADAAIAQLPEGVELSIDQSVRGMTMLATGAQRILGGTFETAMSSAVETFQQLAQSRQQLGDVFTGMSGDFPELASGISRAFGSVDGALNAMMQSPERFVMEMQSMYESMDETSRRRFQREALTQFPTAIQHMVVAGEAGRRQMEELVRPVENAEGALSDMAQGASGSTRTFAEAMDLLGERFQHQMNMMVRSFPGYENFERRVLQRQRESYERLGGVIRNLASRQTGIGALTRSFMAFKRGGFQGLMIGLGVESSRALRRMQDGLNEVSPALGDRFAQALDNVKRKAGNTFPLIGALGDSIFDIAGQAMPAATALGAMGLKFGMIGDALKVVGRTLGPFMLLIGIGAGIYYLSKNLDKVKDSISRAASSFRDFGRFVQEISNMVDWNQLGTDLVDGILGAFGVLAGVGEGREMSETAQAISEGFRALFDGVARIVSGLARGMWTRIVEWIMEPPDVESQVQRAGAAAGVTVGGALAVGMMTPMRRSIVGAFGRVFSGIGRFLTGGRALGGGALKMVLKRIPFIGGIIGVLFDLPKIIADFQSGDIVAGFRTLLISIADGLLMGIPSLITRLTGVDILGPIFDFFMSIPDRIKEITGVDLSQTVSNFFEGGLDGAISYIQTWGGILVDTFTQWWGYISPLIDEWMAVFGEIGDVLGELWSDTIQPLIEDIFGEMPSLNLGDMFGDAEEGAKGFGDVIRGVLDWLMPKVQWLHRTAMPLVVDGIRAWADHIRRVVGVVRWLWGVGKKVYPSIVSAVNTIVAGFQTWWSAVSFLWNRVIKPVFGFVYRLFRRVFVGFILPMGLRIFRTIGSVINWLWDRVISPIFNRVWDLWSWVMSNIVSGVRRAFNFVKTWITNKIEAAAEAFAILSATWEETKAVLSAGFELIAARVRRYIIVPFLRVRGVLGEMASSMQIAFMRVKETIIGLFQTLMEKVQEAFRSLGALGSAAADRMSAPITAVRQSLTQVRADIAVAEAQATANRAVNQHRIREANDQVRIAEENLAETERQRQRAVAEATVERERARAARARSEREVEREEPSVRPGRAQPPTVSPAVPSPEEQEREVRSRSSRRQGAVRGEQQREAQEVAREMAISGFGSQAKRDLTEAFRAAMPRPGRPMGRRGLTPPTEGQLEGQQL